MSTDRTIVVGGGLAGLSAAHTLLENSKKVLLLDKKPSLGGNSVKASSGINGAETESQHKLNINDTVEAFSTDTTTSAGPLARPALITALTPNSAPALSWLTSQFGIDLSVVSRLGGHSIARTHRDKSGAPGWAITSALMKKLVAAAAAENASAQIVKNAHVARLLEDAGRVVGVEYETAEGKIEERGNVIIATGGYAADFSGGGLLATHTPDLLPLSTTNGDHATGDGHRLAAALSHPAALCDLDQVQVHPTGFVDPANADAKAKFLAAEALRGVGGLIIDREGRRFVNEVGRRDVVTERMEAVIREGRGPVRLVLNKEAVGEIKLHCDFHVSKGLMKPFANAKEFSEASGIPLENLATTFTISTRSSQTAKEKTPSENLHSTTLSTQSTPQPSRLSFITQWAVYPSTPPHAHSMPMGAQSRGSMRRGKSSVVCMGRTGSRARRCLRLSSLGDLQARVQRGVRGVAFGMG